MLAPIVQISQNTIISRKRKLPTTGKVVVRQGQKVEARDIIAEAILAPEHTLLDISRNLNVSAEKADDLIQLSAGESVNKGDLIAGPAGITQRVVRAPQNGRIVLAGDGIVLMQVNSTPHEIRAGMPGTITNLIPERGAVIETYGALVQGVWGNGHAEFGLMQAKLASPDEHFLNEHLDVSLRGGILVAGYCADAQVLQKAAEIPLRGLIFASMDSALIPVALKMPYPILVLEGFGYHPMNAIGYNVLTSNSRKEISLNAAHLDLDQGIRPEVVIPLDVTNELEDTSQSVDDFALGNHVRIIRAPHVGKVGTIESLSPRAIIFPSGVRAVGAEVKLENGEHSTVPLANLEKIV
jgi:hypothetical protein